ncbi:MAG: hypothetical protein AAF743_07440, partial [Planctomycetota bacterium]
MTFRLSNRIVPCIAVMCLLAHVARAQSVADDRVAPDQNHQPGVSLEVFEGLPGATATNDDPTATVSPDTWAYLPIVLDGQTPNVSVVTDKIFVGDNGIA